MKRNYKKIVDYKRKLIQQWYQENLKTIRTLCGLTLSDISKNTGISVQTLSLIENGKKLPYYQYIVIRRYIDSFLTDSLRHSMIDLIDDYKYFEVFDFATELIKPLLSVTISIICNDSGIWSTKEQDFIKRQWEQIKVNCQERDDAPTAKTYSRIFIEEFSELKIINILKAFQYASENGYENFESLSNNSAEIDYINFIEQIENLSPIDKISIFVFFELFYVILFCIPIDEAISQAHINLKASTLEDFRKYSMESFPRNINMLETMTEVKRTIDSHTDDSGNLNVEDLSLNQLSDLKMKFDELASTDTNWMQNVSPFILFDSNTDDDTPLQERFEPVILDWIRLSRTAMLKLTDLNDWFYSTTFDCIENASIKESDNSFIISLVIANWTRYNLNTKRWEELFPNSEQ